MYFSVGISFWNMLQTSYWVGVFNEARGKATLRVFVLKIKGLEGFCSCGWERNTSPGGDVIGFLVFLWDTEVIPLISVALGEERCARKGEENGANSATVSRGVCSSSLTLMSFLPGADPGSWWGLLLIYGQPLAGDMKVNRAPGVVVPEEVVPPSVGNFLYLMKALDEVYIFTLSKSCMFTHPPMPPPRPGLKYLRIARSEIS